MGTSQSFSLGEFGAERELRVMLERSNAAGTTTDVAWQVRLSPAKALDWSEPWCVSSSNVFTRSNAACSSLRQEWLPAPLHL